MSCAISLWGLTKRFGERSPSTPSPLSLPAPFTGWRAPTAPATTPAGRSADPQRGTIRVLGLDPVSRGSLLRQHLGYMPQFRPLRDLSRENLTLYADLRGVLEPERTPTFARLLAFPPILPASPRGPGKLFGGMKQKLGPAPCSAPRMLLLDEPRVGVDPIPRRALWQMVRGNWQRGMTVLWEYRLSR